MSDHPRWLLDLDGSAAGSTVDGLVSVSGYQRGGRPPEEVAMMEKAAAYQARAVFFEAGRNGGPAVAQAFVFVSEGPARRSTIRRIASASVVVGRGSAALP